MDLASHRRWISCVLLVGYHTLVDADIIEGSAAKEELSANLTMPVQEALAAAGLVLPLDTLADPRIAVGKTDSQTVQRQLKVYGEQICSVQYRKVCFRWVFSRDLDGDSLAKKNR